MSETTPAKRTITMVPSTNRAAERKRFRAYAAMVDARANAVAYWILSASAAAATAASIAYGEAIEFEPSWGALGVLTCLSLVTGAIWWRKTNAIYAMLEDLEYDRIE